jgi:hypothetical protein
MSYQNLITALEESDPAQLASLRTRFTANKSLFSAARELGPAHKPQPNDKAIKSQSGASALQMDAMMALAEAGIETMRKRVDDLLAFILRRMKAASRIKLVGSIAAAASGLVSAALAVSDGMKEITQLTAASFSFIGGIVALLADQIVRTPSGVPIASSEEHAKIVDMRVEVERMALRLSRSGQKPLSQEDLSQILDALDEQALKMIRYQSS